MITFDFKSGNIPILVSMPHNGVKIPKQIQATMTDSALKLTDTDWFLDRLYQFTQELGCYVIEPHYSRYLIDLNRPQDNANLYPGQDTTELCPTTQFDLDPIYLEGQEPNDTEIKNRVQNYWAPYHNRLQSTLKTIKSEYGIAVLFEAHSIKSYVARFFDGKLPDFNFGNLDGQTCSKQLTRKLEDWKPDGYSKVINGRFKGGYITRAYASPERDIHAIQLELSQATYMDEQSLSYSSTKALKVQKSLQQMFDIFKQFVSHS